MTIIWFITGDLYKTLLLQKHMASIDMEALKVGTV